MEQGLSGRLVTACHGAHQSSSCIPASHTRTWKGTSLPSSLTTRPNLPGLRGPSAGKSEETVTNDPPVITLVLVLDPVP